MNPNTHARLQKFQAIAVLNSLDVKFVVDEETDKITAEVMNERFDVVRFRQFDDKLKELRKNPPQVKPEPSPYKTENETVSFMQKVKNSFGRMLAH